MSALVGCSAPEIIADAVWSDGSVRPGLLANSRLRNVALFFYPPGFTRASSPEFVFERQNADFTLRVPRWSAVRWVLHPPPVRGDWRRAVKMASVNFPAS